ncbi:MAG: ribonuclease D [Alphaproteobacteria bacterium]|nr:ribonuclease D [Alphaproteobacteria bacterium]
MSLITTTEQLRIFCKKQEKTNFVTVDTEFMREKTYWPKVCLIQVGGEDEAVAIDPLAQGIDLGPLYELMTETRVLKVFHAARQDVEIFYKLMGAVPSPMVDTQVAAMVCGFGESASYETLVASLTGKKVDKTSRFTDWARRPLSDKQLEYALGDVTHLRDVYRKLEAALEKNARRTWVGEEMAFLRAPSTYAADPKDAWKRLKLRTDKPRVRALAQAIAAWREEEAQRLDVPRGRVLRDEAVLEIVYHPPRTADDLAKIRGLSKAFAEGRQGRALLGVVEAALQLPPSACPSEKERRNLPGGLGSSVDLLKVLLKHVSEDSGVAAKLIATTEDLEDFLADEVGASVLLKGWRKELFGDLAQELRKGSLTIGLKGKKIIFKER